MSDYSLFEKGIRRIKQALVPVLAPSRRHKLNNTDFTIISNNCWGGLCYEYFGLPKLSPTIGAYFFADDYLRFASNLSHYLDQRIRIVSAYESKHFDSLKQRNQLDVPIGVIDDVEIVFLHYLDPKIAMEKWQRRCQRVNFDNLIFKFSYTGECESNHIDAFEKIDCGKKVFFSAKPISKYDNIIVVPGNREGIVANDTFYWNKYIDVVELINKGKVIQKHTGGRSALLEE